MYQAKFARSEGVSITQLAVSKTETQFTAVNSFISANAVVHTVAATHYQVLDDIGNIHSRVNEKGSKGAKLLYKLV